MSQPFQQIEGDSAGLKLLQHHWSAGTPLVALLGQTAGWSNKKTDPVLERALQHAEKVGRSWKNLLTHKPLSDDYYQWLSDRFRNRPASESILEALKAPWSAIFTSSIDNGLANCVAGDGREAEVILHGDPAPRVLRNTRRPPFYYLFGLPGQHVTSLKPPLSLQAAKVRSIQHSSSMLRRIQETATPIGLIVVDGYDPLEDWLKAEDLLAALTGAPLDGVLWCGPTPNFEENDQITFDELVERKTVIREEKVLGDLVKELLEVAGVPSTRRWDDPELVTLKNGGVIKTTPNLRLLTQASATLVDDTWASKPDSLPDDQIKIAFHSFHATSTSFRSVADGVHMGFSIKRTFEVNLRKRVESALDQHHTASAIIVHGQSGVGKTIALARLAIFAKSSGFAVLFSGRRVPQANDLITFLSSVDQQQGTTLLIVDTMSPPSRYDDLLRALKSVGHRVVLVGTSYRLDHKETRNQRFIEVPAILDKQEQASLIDLARKYAPSSIDAVKRERKSEYALASFYRLLPPSRGRLSTGLGKEVENARHRLRARVEAVKPPMLTILADAFRRAKYPFEENFFLPVSASDPTTESPEARAIDLVMVSSRLFKAVPMSIALRAVGANSGSTGSYDIDTLLALVRGQDLFRWTYPDEDRTDVLLEARLQVEARLICESRFGSSTKEAEAIGHLIEAATRAGPEPNDETTYVIELVQAAGPDGPEGERYSESYATLARALTNLRQKTAVPNARLMLQESVLRRHYLRTQNNIEQAEKTKLLSEAVTAVDDALRLIEEDGHTSISASLQTKHNLWNERAAAYGFVATDRVEKGSSGEAYTAYKAAHEAATIAKARLDSSYSLDVSLWMPTRILKQGTALTDEQRIEISADLRSSLDSVDESTLDEEGKEKFQSRRLNAANAMGDLTLSDDAFRILDEAGSTAGYFIRARQLAPDTKDRIEPSPRDLIGAKACVAYLRENYARISQDYRCLQLLLDMEWAIRTKRWLMRGFRQPFPHNESTRKMAQSIISDIATLGEDKLSTKYRYLRAVTTWLEGNEQIGTQLWHELDHDTKFTDPRRVMVRHVLSDENGVPIMQRGVIERQFGSGRWSVRVDGINGTVDLIADYFPQADLSIGRTVTNFAVAFNYRGPLADPPGGPHRGAR